MTTNIISEDEFWNIWQPQLGEDGNLKTYEEVVNMPLTQVWTIVDTGGEDDSWFAVPGFRVVNKMGYITTLKHWDDNTPDALYYEVEDENE